MNDYLTNRLHDGLQEKIAALRTSKDEARKHYRYHYGDQLSQEVLAILQRRGQPVRWENEYRKIAAKIKKIKEHAAAGVKMDANGRAIGGSAKKSDEGFNAATKKPVVFKPFDPFGD